jgi:hypothetical protein
VANLVAHHVDDLEGWMAGLVGMLRVGGWAVITEFGREEGGRDVAGEVRNEQSLERAAELEARRKDDVGISVSHHIASPPSLPPHSQIAWRWARTVLSRVLWEKDHCSLIRL